MQEKKKDKDNFPSSGSIKNSWGRQAIWWPKNTPQPFFNCTYDLTLILTFIFLYQTSVGLKRLQLCLEIKYTRANLVLYHANILIDALEIQLPCQGTFFIQKRNPCLILICVYFALSSITDFVYTSFWPYNEC